MIVISNATYYYEVRTYSVMVHEDGDEVIFLTLLCRQFDRDAEGGGGRGGRWNDFQRIGSNDLNHLQRFYGKPTCKRDTLPSRKTRTKIISVLNIFALKKFLKAVIPLIFGKNGILHFSTCRAQRVEYFTQLHQLHAVFTFVISVDRTCNTNIFDHFCYVTFIR
jgi:hypothetical protein